MKLSKLIKQLQKINDKHGDMIVMVRVDDYHVDVEKAEFRKKDTRYDDYDYDRAVIQLGETEGIDY